MRRLKIIGTCIIVAVILAMFSTEIFAATYLNLSVTGNLKYYATELGARIWGGYMVCSGSTPNYDHALPISFASPNGGSVTPAENGDIFEISGEEEEFVNIMANMGSSIAFGSSTQLYIYIFVKNTGDRYLVPWGQIEAPGCLVQDESYYFDISSVQDPLVAKNSVTTMQYLSTIDARIDGGDAQEFQMNSTLDRSDVYLKRYILERDPAVSQSDETTLSIAMNFMADIDYSANDILHVYQAINQNSPAWTKYGYNSTLDVSATKMNESSLDNLATRLYNANGANLSANMNDDYKTAVVFKDIDLVNIDIATGEPIGRLSDRNYDFEWFGGRVSLDAGTTLASGRVLSVPEVFTVDVYTWYPTMYMRRGMIGNEQWISVSDKPFVGAVKIDGWYTATYESTLFSPKIAANGDVTYYYATPTGAVLRDVDSNIVYGTTSSTRNVGGVDYYSQVVYEVSYNEYGVFPRSYIFDKAPFTEGSVRYFLDNYMYEDNSGTQAVPATATTTQTNMLYWANNLSQKWQARNSMDLPTYLPHAKTAQGENYTAFVWIYLYLIKYANNNTQEMVGAGVTRTYELYNVSGKTVNTPKNGVISTQAGNNEWFESPKSGGVIGCQSTTVNAAYKLTNTNMAYGTEYLSYLDESSNNYLKKRGLFAPYFLTYDTGYKRVLLDGYVGSNEYTPVYCLGLANPWSNVWTWVFGIMVTGNGVDEIHLWATFENYDTTNWAHSWPNTSMATYLTTGSMNYHKASFFMPANYAVRRYLDVSKITTDDKQMLIGAPSTASAQASNNYQEGLCDYYHVGTNNIRTYSEKATYGLLKGGSGYDKFSAGLFYYRIGDAIDKADIDFGLRMMLV